MLLENSGSISTRVKFIEPKSGMGLPGARGDENKELLINGNKVSVKQDEKL